MAGAAAAIVGTRLGTERARKEMCKVRVGAHRQRIVDEAVSQALEFERLFNRQPQGPAEQRLRGAFKKYKGPAGKSAEEDIDFICQVADADKNGVLDPEELNFAFRIYCVWADRHTAFEQQFRKHDVDGSGALDRVEFQKFLVELNEGAQVKDDEVAWVMEKADVNRDGKVQFVELIIAVSVWYCDIPVLRERRPPCLPMLDVLSLIFLSRETRYTQRRQRVKDQPLLRGLKKK